MSKITVQALNSTTGEVLEVIISADVETEQEAVNLLFSIMRSNDYYYLFTGAKGVISPSGDTTPVVWKGRTYYTHTGDETNPTCVYV